MTSAATSSILVAATLEAEPDHEAAVELLETYVGDIVVVDLSLLEVQFLLRREGLPGWQRTQVLRGIHNTFIVVSLNQGENYERAFGVMEQYEALELDLTDAALVALAEIRRDADIGTLDHRDFRAITPNWPATDAYRLLPADAIS